jgi:hypothetical protein
LTSRPGLSALLSAVSAVTLSTSVRAQEIILDPELEAISAGPSTESAPPSVDSTVAAPPSQSADIRVVLRSRLGVDLVREEPREDVWEATQLALFEARVRRSERLAFTVGLRARHLVAARAQDTNDANAERFELDVAPTALHADVMVVDQVHLRLGYQGVHLGRFDVLGASNVLSRADLRAGPTTLPEQSEIAQPAVSVNWDLSSAIALRAIYVPFFAPHLINAFEGDYALSPARQRDVDAAFETSSQMVGTDVAALWRSALSRSGQARFFEGGFSAFAPDPSLAQPQAGARLSAHGAAGELALTAASALEHLPTLQLVPSTGLPDVTYGRYAVLSADAATALGPAQVGVELAYSTDRTLYTTAANTGAEAALMPRETDVAQLAVRAEWVGGERWLVAAEASGAYMLADPPNSQDWLFTTARRWQLAAVGFIARRVPSLGLTLELAGGLLSGPTYLVTPRIELRLWEQLYVEVGAYVVGGGGPHDLSRSGATLGRLYETVDQGFMGLRWVL